MNNGLTIVKLPGSKRWSACRVLDLAAKGKTNFLKKQQGGGPGRSARDERETHPLAHHVVVAVLKDNLGGVIALERDEAEAA